MVVIVPGSIVWIAAFDEVPRHLFRVDVVHGDCVEGVALTTPETLCALLTAPGSPPNEGVLTRSAAALDLMLSGERR